MPPYLCLLCKNYDLEYFNLYYEASVRHHVVEFCGEGIKVHLRGHQFLCRTCWEKIRIAVELRRLLLNRLLMNSEKISTNRIGNNDALVNGLAYDEDSCASDADENDGDGDVINFLPSHSSNNSVRAMTPFRRSYIPHNMAVSPNNLLMVKHSIPFDQRSEADMEEEALREYHERETPNLDKEVQRAYYRGRKRKSYNWTRRKGSQRSRSHSRVSRASRSTSRRSVASSHKERVIKIAKTEQKARILSDFINVNDSLSQFTHAYLSKSGEAIGENELIKRSFERTASAPRMKTRYASALRDRLIAEYQEYVFECPHSSCEVWFLSLEEITRHRIGEHNEMALYCCEQCKIDYITQEYLDKHKLQRHQNLLSYCIYCGEGFNNKQLYEIHSNEHLEYSITCAYCDKSFLSKSLCRSHMRDGHSGQDKTKKSKPQTILDRIDKEQISENSTNLVDKVEHFVVRTLYQHGNTDESCVNEEEFLSDSVFNVVTDTINMDTETAEEQAIETENNSTEISEPSTDT